MVLWGFYIWKSQSDPCCAYIVSHGMMELLEALKASQNHPHQQHKNSMTLGALPNYILGVYTLGVYTPQPPTWDREIRSTLLGITLLGSTVSGNRLRISHPTLWGIFSRSLQSRATDFESPSPLIGMGVYTLGGVHSGGLQSQATALCTLCGFTLV